ncbi:hypothetical protein BCR43DRAFT_483815 [Syncephalastrum racemosum]|uniref:Secreted protein n=1 Tax=Syncephalastrum racemosum TaxID=13706 RepID=A0A1X2HW40_SYNRA|nr:hypothetical protein BCR43DRAFT_483815 [Syncephalastrum racemosum]
MSLLAVWSSIFARVCAARCCMCDYADCVMSSRLVWIKRKGELADLFSGRTVIKRLQLVGRFAVVCLRGWFCVLDVKGTNESKSSES